MVKGKEQQRVINYQKLFTTKKIKLKVDIIFIFVFRLYISKYDVKKQLNLKIIPTTFMEKVK